MSYMFYNCKSLNSLDLSNFNINNVKNMNWMFYDNCSLMNIKLSENLKKDPYIKDSMFEKCPKPYMSYIENI